MSAFLPGPSLRPRPVWLLFIEVNTKLLPHLRLDFGNPLNFKLCPVVVALKDVSSILPKRAGFRLDQRCRFSVDLCTNDAICGLSW